MIVKKSKADRVVFPCIKQRLIMKTNGVVFKYFVNTCNLISKSYYSVYWGIDHD